jgi:hypothetical protein
MDKGYASAKLTKFIRVILSVSHITRWLLALAIQHKLDAYNK